MRRIFFMVMLFTVCIIPLQISHAATATVSDVRWVTRNDASISYVRIVLELSSPVKAGATISKDGYTTEITLEHAKMPSAPQRILMNPKILKSALFAQSNDEVLITLDTPAPLDPMDVHIFALKKGLTANKPDRLVIDVKQKNVKPRKDYFGKPQADTSPKVPDRTPYSETGPYRVGGGVKGKVIVIDPGHGGTDPGSISKDGKYQEKEITLPIAEKLRTLLEQQGAKVILTRSGDKDVFGPYASAVDELQARADVGNHNRADIFLSIHINSFTNPSVSGIADYYYQKTPHDKRLAEVLQKHISSQPGMGGDRGTNEAGFYVLDHTVMPAALVELGFMSNTDEVKQLTKSSVQEDFAKLLLKGIVEYFKE